VVAVDEDRPLERLVGLDDPGRLVPRNAIIADRDVDVPHAQPSSRLDVWPGPVHADDRLDPQTREGGESVVALGLAAAVKPSAEAEGILDSLEVKALRLRGRLSLGPSSVPGALLSFTPPRRRLTAQERARDGPDEDRNQTGRPLHHAIPHCTC